jgi:hypothetical protein
MTIDIVIDLLQLAASLVVFLCGWRLGKAEAELDAARSAGDALDDVRHLENEEDLRADESRVQGELQMRRLVRAAEAPPATTPEAAAAEAEEALERARAAEEEDVPW